jgi:hypothetical protein
VNTIRQWRMHRAAANYRPKAFDVRTAQRRGQQSPTCPVYSCAACTSIITCVCWSPPARSGDSGSRTWKSIGPAAAAGGGKHGRGERTRETGKRESEQARTVLDLHDHVVVEQAVQWLEGKVRLLRTLLPAAVDAPPVHEGTPHDDATLRPEGPRQQVGTCRGVPTLN